MKPRRRHWLEYQGARAGVALIRGLPPRLACGLAGGVADLAFALMRRRRQVALDNLLRSGVAPSRVDARRIARASFRHFAYVMVESFHGAGTRAGPSPRLELPAATRVLLETPGQGVIMVSGHLGNWEFGARALTRFKPVTGVARPMNNPRVQALMDRYRMRGDFETIDKHSANPMQLVRALRRGRILALLTDQHARDQAVTINFFGRPAATYPTPAILHRITGAPILFGYAERLGVGRYRAVFSEPLRFDPGPDRDADVLAITRQLAQRLEEAIRQCPEQYLWAHRRWKISDL